MYQVNWSRQFLLALALFVLGLGAYWLEYKHKPEKEAKEELSKKLFLVKDKPTQSISLINGKKTYKFKCLDFDAKLCKPGDNSKWEMIEPLKARADDANLNAVLSNLSNLNSNETIDLKPETPEKRSALIKEYGLDPLSRKTDSQIEVTTSAGTTLLFLGQKHSIGESVFGIKEQVGAGQKPTGNPDENVVYLIPSYFTSNLDHDLTYWRDKKVLTLNAHQIQAIELNGTKAKLSAQRKEGQWIITSGKEEFLGDIENMDSLLNAATYLTAKDFASENKNNAQAKATLKGLGVVLSLVLYKEKGDAKEAPAPITLSLFQKKPIQPNSKVYATVSNLDPLFELDSGSRERLDKSLKDLRLSKLITSMERFSAKRLEFSGKPIGPKSLILVNKDGKWVNSLNQTEVASEKVQDTLEKLSANKIKEFLSGSAIPGGEQEGLKLTLGDDQSETKRSFLFWKKGDQLYARDLQSKRKEAFLLDPSLKDGLPWNSDFYKKSESKTESKSDKPKK